MERRNTFQHCSHQLGLLHQLRFITTTRCTLLRRFFKTNIKLGVWHCLSKIGMLNELKCRTATVVGVRIVDPFARLRICAHAGLQYNCTRYETYQSYLTCDIPCVLKATTRVNSSRKYSNAGCYRTSCIEYTCVMKYLY